MRSYGHLNMQQNELQEAVLQIEQNFPAIPIPGRLVFKDHVLSICIEIAEGTPVWIPLTNVIDSYNFVQSGSSNQWYIRHNLNTTMPSVTIYGADSRVVYPDDIEVIDNNTVLVSFGTPITGRATILSGNQSGGARQSYSFEYTQTTPSNSWVIKHNLGYQPIIRIFVGNTEVFPSSITFDSNFQVTVTFSQSYVGMARLI
jgi:hypothetical protein